MQGLHEGERSHRLQGRPHRVQLRLLRGEVMSLLNLKKFGFLAASVGLLALVAIQGCSSDDTQATPGSGGKNSTAGSAGSKGGSGPNAGSSNGGSSGEEDQPMTDGGAAGENGEGGAGGEAPVDPGCLGEDDCYKCEPKTNNQFLNACVEGGCPASFDNSTLSKLNLVGTL